MKYDKNDNFVWPQDIEELMGENLGDDNPYVLNELPFDGKEFGGELNDGEV